LIIGGAAGALALSGGTTTQTTTVAAEPTTVTTTATVTVTGPAPQPTAPGATPTPTPSPGRLSAGAKEAFLTDCLVGYSHEQPGYEHRYDYCLCVVNHLEGTVTERELFQLTADDPRLRNAEHACVGHLAQG